MGAPGGAASAGRRQYGNLAEINVTPLVDVMLVLLIIFMLTAPFIVGGVDVNLPHTRTTAKASVEGLILTVDKQRRIYVDEDPIPLSQLAEVLREIRPLDDPRPVYLRSDQEVPYGFVVRVMGVVQEAGIEGLSLVVDPTEEN
ncbi:MAG: ExbD/TolR family protein [Candidatus Latescibacteria bacterium]|nr:ExbD/TolR family protein [bacterium]MCB9516482.1 ExbD/TolR family protein [Candidatus Latescibacterota bacterium]